MLRSSLSDSSVDAKRRSPLNSFSKAAVFCVMILSCGADPEADTVARGTNGIVGGTVTPVGAFPAVVSIGYDQSLNPPWYCGGTLIGDRWILTAAHCMEVALNNLYEVRIGRHDITSNAGQVVGISKIVPHPSYTENDEDDGPLDSDLALVKLSVPVAGPFVRLVSPQRMSEILLGDDVTVLGWGRTSEGGPNSNLLRQATVDVMGTGQTCNAATAYNNVTSNEICLGVATGGRDTCTNDSGGPALITRDGETFLLGVTSWGDGCARANKPGVYTFAPNFFDFVMNTVTGAPPPSLLPSAQIMAVTG